MTTNVLSADRAGGVGTAMASRRPLGEVREVDLHITDHTGDFPPGLSAWGRYPGGLARAEGRRRRGQRAQQVAEAVRGTGLAPGRGGTVTARVRTEHPAPAAAATRAWSSAVRRAGKPPAAR